MTEKLVELIRDGTIESIHLGSLVVVESSGKILFQLGDPQRITFFHSSAKPIQAITALEAGIAEKYSLELKEIAIMSSSHAGDREHLETLEKIMKKLDVKEKDLLCGTHEPYSKEAARELIKSGRQPTQLHCNCSGKHLGIIAASKTKGLTLEDYFKPEHGMQEETRKVIADFADINEEQIVMAIDGCGIPVYGIPLFNMALAYANISSMDFMDGKYRKSQNYLLSAMTMHPEMIAGAGRLDTELMKRLGDRLIIKTGAEAVSCIGLLGKSIGIALKIDDGNPRAVSPVVLETLRQLGLINDEKLKELEEFWIPPVKNNNGLKVGELRPVFKLN